MLLDITHNEKYVMPVAMRMRLSCKIRQGYQKPWWCSSCKQARILSMYQKDIKRLLAKEF